ncbi:hypothetical protein GM3708_3526 (plasmid) [Geminocystis sp. NIES-3708]|uniref:hypothetical protein n=1 Tax=Geminocystis sp. NIES-3708 TaxID=1615909 RepID=UPI0005FC823F|nr:hypothetical protein [Geminocystis sp. NIES-3708]BAQ63120.1 hypothetical protein GM3708_3526 [Geminocystis sp. NIES-3708]
MSSQKIVNDIDNNLSSQCIDSIDNNKLTDTIKEDITENNTLSESSSLPVNEELGH